MSNPALAQIFDIGSDITSSSMENGLVTLQTGSLFGGDGDAEIVSNNVELWAPSGYVARPAKADNKEGPQSISLSRGDHDITVAVRDYRVGPIVESLGYGEVQVFAGGPNNSGFSKIVLNNDGTNQQITITAGSKIIRVKSDGTVILGSGDDSVMLGTDLLSWISQVNTALTTISGAAGNFVPPIVVPTASPKASNKVKASF